MKIETQQKCVYFLVIVIVILLVVRHLYRCPCIENWSPTTPVFQNKAGSPIDFQLANDKYRETPPTVLNIPISPNWSQSLTNWMNPNQLIPAQDCYSIISPEQIAKIRRSITENFEDLPPGTKVVGPIALLPEDKGKDAFFRKDKAIIIESTKNKSESARTGSITPHEWTEINQNVGDMVKDQLHVFQNQNKKPPTLLRGSIGPRGNPGLPGNDGYAGEQGRPGPKGESGLEGPPGIIGPIGLRGTQGIPGPPGKLGIQGIQGPRGDIGLTGSVGIQGPEGPPGKNGGEGPPGEPGVPGQKVFLTSEESGRVTAYAQGLRGPKGDRGLQGERGSPGLSGIQGIAGKDGIQGNPGEKGDRGERGIVGPNGLLALNDSMNIHIDTHFDSGRKKETYERQQSEIVNSMQGNMPGLILAGNHLGVNQSRNVYIHDNAHINGDINVKGKSTHDAPVSIRSSIRLEGDVHTETKVKPVGQVSIREPNKLESPYHAGSVIELSGDYISGNRNVWEAGTNGPVALDAAQGFFHTGLQIGPVDNKLLELQSGKYASHIRSNPVSTEGGMSEQASFSLWGGNTSPPEDTNLGLGSIQLKAVGEGGEIQFITRNQERMRINANGQMSIGPQTLGMASQRLGSTLNVQAKDDTRAITIRADKNAGLEWKHSKSRIGQDEIGLFNTQSAQLTNEYENENGTGRAFAFYSSTNDGDRPSEKMRLSSKGQLSINGNNLLSAKNNRNQVFISGQDNMPVALGLSNANSNTSYQTAVDPVSNQFQIRYQSDIEKDGETQFSMNQRGQFILGQPEKNSNAETTRLQLDGDLTISHKDTAARIQADSKHGFLIQRTPQTKGEEPINWVHVNELGNVGFSTRRSPTHPLTFGPYPGKGKINLYDTGTDQYPGIGTDSNDLILHTRDKTGKIIFQDDIRDDIAMNIMTLAGNGRVGIRNPDPQGDLCLGSLCISQDELRMMLNNQRRLIYANDADVILKSATYIKSSGFVPVGWRPLSGNGSTWTIWTTFNMDPNQNKIMLFSRNFKMGVSIHDGYLFGFVGQQFRQQFNVATAGYLTAHEHVSPNKLGSFTREKISGASGLSNFPGEWFHFAVTFLPVDTNNIKVTSFVNGQFQWEYVLIFPTGIPNITDPDWYYGSDENPVQGAFTASGLRLFEATLSGEQIQSAYNDQLGTNTQYKRKISRAL